MKCYLTGETIRLAGKAWEIRHYLRRAAAAAPHSITMIDWLRKG